MPLHLQGGPFQAAELQLGQLGPDVFLLAYPRLAQVGEVSSAWAVLPARSHPLELQA